MLAIIVKKSWPFLVLGLAILVFFWPNLTWPAININPSVGTNDFVDKNIPFRHFLLESVKNGEWPLWSSAISAGYPIFAEGLGALSPLVWLTAFFPLMFSVNLSLVANYFLIGIFAYLFLRESGMSRLAAAFGSVGASFCGFAVNELMHWDILTSFVFFLAQLYFLEKLENRRQAVWIFAGAFAVGLQWLGGHPQMNFYSAIFAGLYFLAGVFFRKEKGGVSQELCRRLGFLGVMMGLGAGIGLGQILPTLEFTRQSTRAGGLATEAINRYNFSFEDLITFIFPYALFDPAHTPEALAKNGWPADEKYVFVGWLTLILAGWQIIRSWRKDRQTFSLVLILIIAFLLVLGPATVFGSLLLLPPFNFFRLPLRFVLFVDFALVMLAAGGMEGILRKFGQFGSSSAYRAVVGITVLFLTFAQIFYYGQKLHPPYPASEWYAPTEVEKFLQERIRPGERVFSETLYWPTYRIFINQPDLWDNPKIFINLRNLLPIFNHLFSGVEMVAGAANSAGLKISRYNELEYYLVFSGLKYLVPDQLEIDKSWFFLNRLLGTRYVLLTEKINHPLLNPVFQTSFNTGQDQVIVYELVDFYPRAFLVPKAEFLPPAEIKKHLMEGDFSPKEKVFLEEAVDWGSQGGFAGSAVIEEYTNQRVRIKTRASGDNFLFLTDNYYPGWRVYVDGREEKIYRANYAFRAVKVAGGEHEVVFQYEPLSFRRGLIASAVFAVLAAAGLWLAAVKKVAV